jgi:Na+/H+ antiporter NhaA
VTFLGGVLLGLLIGGPLGILLTAFVVTAAKADRALDFDHLEYIDDDDDL